MEIKDLSCRDFVHALGSKAPAPGGGGAAALAGALGVALGDMVACFTIGKKKYADVEEKMQQLKSRCEEMENELLALIDADAEAFVPLAKAYADPGIDKEPLLRDSARVPLDIMRLAAEGIRIMEEMAASGSAIMVSDAGCGAVCCRAALEAGALNVFINTKAMKDREYAEKINAEVDALLKDGVPLAEKIYDGVKAKCR